MLFVWITDTNKIKYKITCKTIGEVRKLAKITQKIAKTIIVVTIIRNKNILEIQNEQRSNKIQKHP